MGVTIGFESHTCELPAIFQFERDPEILEFYDQPGPIKLTYPDLNGRTRGVMHTPDFFVLKTSAAGWIELKYATDLELLAQKMPHRYIKTPEGLWTCPPGSAFASEYGLSYSILTAESFSKILIRNLEHLDDYYRNPPALEAAFICAIRLLVADAPGITIAELQSKDSRCSIDRLNTLIAGGQLFTALDRFELLRPERVPLYTTAEAVLESPKRIRVQKHLQCLLPEIGSKVSWGSAEYQLVSLGPQTVDLLAQNGQVVPLPPGRFDQLVRESVISFTAPASEQKEQRLSAILSAGPKELEVMNKKLKAISEGSSEVTLRTIQKWRRDYRAAEAAGGFGIEGLRSKTHLRGNRKQKLPPQIYEIMRKFISENYETPKNRRLAAVYRSFVLLCQKQGLLPPSYVTFSKHIKNRPVQNQIRKRKGSRAANDKEEWFWVLDQATPIHGDRPFHIGHLDHTELEIECVCSQTGTNLGRPWLSLLVDAFSRRILALHITFDPPSVRSCMMLVRICVKRHGRLPQILVMDGGPEFRSVYFESLLAACEVTKKQRPRGKPRSGSLVERLFGTVHTMFVHDLQGNTQLMKNPRRVTRSVNPKKHAVWTLESFQAALERFCYEEYDTRPHPTIDLSPRNCFNQGLQATGHRSHRIIRYDDAFKILTLPSPARPEVLVHYPQGIRIGHIDYWNEEFRNPSLHGKKVSVRYDPFDLGAAYAYVGARWVKCVSTHAGRFQGRTEKELRLIAEEFRRKKSLHSKGRAASSAQLAQFISKAESAELTLQRLRDGALKRAQMVEDHTGSHSPEDFAVPSLKAPSKSSRPIKRSIPKAEDLETFGTL